MAQRNIRKNLENHELQILAVEFKVESFSGMINQELEMFTPNGLIIPRLRSGSYPDYMDSYVPVITFHWTNGDYTQRFADCPW